MKSLLSDVISAAVKSSEMARKSEVEELAVVEVVAVVEEEVVVVVEEEVVVVEKSSTELEMVEEEAKRLNISAMEVIQRMRKRARAEALAEAFPEGLGLMSEQERMKRPRRQARGLESRVEARRSERLSGGGDGVEVPDGTGADEDEQAKCGEEGEEGTEQRRLFV